MQQDSDSVQDLAGNVIPGAAVRVTVKATGALATLLADDEVTLLGNPVYTDSNGRYEYKAANGTYKVDIEAGGRTFKGKEVTLFDPEDAALPLSVKDFGARGDGVFNNLLAFTDAYSAAAPGSRIRVPSGVYAGVSGTLTGAKFVIWETDGQPSGGGIWSLPGSIEQGFTSRKICAIQQTQPDGDNKFSFNRVANHSGGTPGFVCSNTYTYTNAGKDNDNFEWNAIFVLDNYADAGENCAFYSQGNKRGIGPTWASALEAIDHTNTNNPTFGLIGQEIAVRANGTDDNKNRIGMDMVADRFIKTSGAFSHLSYGFRVQNNNDSASLVKVAYGIVANNVQVGFDTSEAIIQTAAFRMASGQGFAFDAAAQHQLKYDGSGINYVSGGSSKVRLNADGSILLNGAMKINAIFNTGTQTPTIGTNKPGTTGGAPGTWASIVINGTQYWMPLWTN